MLDIKRIRDNYEEVLKSVESRTQGDFGLPAIRELDEKYRALLTETEGLKSKQNAASKEISRLKKEGGDASEVLTDMKLLSDTIKEKEFETKELESQLRNALLEVPNTPQTDVPVGADDSANTIEKISGDPTVFDFEAKPHWDVGTDLDILDFERAAKIAGARFAVYKGLGARLERSVIGFMLDLHTGAHDYTEILPPFLVNRDAMIGTGQLPKFEDDMFHLESKDFFLIPTAEVPVTNLLSSEILNEADLPIRYTAYTPCFRKEAGSAGRDTRGLIRVHQFNKVELVKFTTPETSNDELMSLLADAEEVLTKLELPYRVVQLATGDLGFASSKTFDIEVWMPSYNRYVEISSCSNYESFQARRAGIRFRRADGGKPEFAHTLNGSGLAVGRTVAAILENYQNSDGSVTVPEVLRSYMNTDKITGK